MDKVGKLAEIKSEALNDCKIKMQHNLNKNTAKERILSIIDEGSFIEVGGMAQKNGGGVITGYGTVEGKLVFVCSHDYTVDGGALTRRNGAKVCRIMDMAVEMGAPLIQIYDSIGAKVSEGLEVLETYGKILKKNSEISGVIPHIAVIAGPTSGMDTISAGMCDFVVILKEAGTVSLSSEAAISAVEGKMIDKNDMSSSLKSTECGVAQIEVEDENGLGVELRKLISFMPSNNKSMSPQSDEVLDINEAKTVLNDFANAGEVSSLNIIKEIADGNSVVNINERVDDNSHTVLAKMNGLTVGIVGIDNNKGIDSKTCDKVSRFVKVCDNFNIPMVSILDNEGFVSSLEEETAGIAVAASRLMMSIGMSDSAKVALVSGNAIGSSFLTFASKEFGFDMVYAWPSAKISAQNPVEAIKRDFADEITSSDVPRKTEKKVIEENIEKYTNPYEAAFEGIIDEVIEPAETKVRIYSAIDMLQTKRVLKYPKKNGSHLI